MLVAMLPLLSLLTSFGIHLSSFLLLAAALAYHRAAANALRRSWRQTRPFILVLLASLLFEMCRLLLPGRLDWSALEQPSRMLLAASAMLVVQVCKPKASVFWYAVSAGAVGAAGLSAWQHWTLGIIRPGGWINPITFGDLAFSLALLALASASQLRRMPQLSAPLLGVLGGIAALLLSGTRGAWLALLTGAPLLWHCRRAFPRRPCALLLALSLALFAAAVSTPQTGVRARLAISYADASAYAHGNPAATPLTIRLELWKAALMLARERPLTGYTTPHYKQRMRAWIAEGKLDAAVFADPEPPHLHNDALQALATKGVPGLLLWFALIAAPLHYFLRCLSGHPSRELGTAALAGALFVLAYAGFGLSEVIFWSLKASLFYALMVFMLMGFCLNAQEAAVRPAAAASADSRQAGPGSRRRSPATECASFPDASDPHGTGTGPSRAPPRTAQAAPAARRGA